MKNCTIRKEARGYVVHVSHRTKPGAFDYQTMGPFGSRAAAEGQVAQMLAQSDAKYDDIYEMLSQGWDVRFTLGGISSTRRHA